MLTAKLDGSYRKAITGTKVFRFVVSGSESEIEAYKSAQEDNFRTDEDGKPLFFSTRYLSDNIKLIITENNNVVVDDTEYSKLASLVDQFGAETARLIIDAQRAQANG